MDRQQRIDHYIQRLSDEKFEIYDVRRELEQLQVEEGEIKIIVRAVDDEIQRRLLAKGTRDYSAEFIRIGIILMVVAAGVTVGTVIDIVSVGNFLFVYYVPFFVGLSMLLVGLFKRKKNSQKYSANQNDGSRDKPKIIFKRSQRS